MASLCHRWKFAVPSFVLMLSLAQYEKCFRMDLLSLETWRQLIVFHIVMSGDFLYISLKMKINCFSVLYGEDKPDLHFPFPLAHLHICSFSVRLCPWATGIYVSSFALLVVQCNGVMIQMRTFAYTLHWSMQCHLMI